MNPISEQTISTMKQEEKTTIAQKQEIANKFLDSVRNAETAVTECAVEAEEEDRESSPENTPNEQIELAEKRQEIANKFMDSVLGADFGLNEIEASCLQATLVNARAQFESRSCPLHVLAEYKLPSEDVTECPRMLVAERVDGDSCHLIWQFLTPRNFYELEELPFFMFYEFSTDLQQRIQPVEYPPTEAEFTRKYFTSFDKREGGRGMELTGSRDNEGDLYFIFYGEDYITRITLPFECERPLTAETAFWNKFISIDKKCQLRTDCKITRFKVPEAHLRKELGMIPPKDEN